MEKADIARSLVDALDAGARAVLVIVAGTTGSAPREPGAWMAVHADGRVEGTVGGGALESRAIDDARGLLASGCSRFVRYTSQGSRSDTGMVCGGAVELLSVCVGAGHRGALARMLELLDADELGEFSVDLACLGGEIPSEEHGESCARTADAPVPLLVEALDGARPPHAGVHGGRYRETVCRPARAIVFGCGHVGRAVTEVLGFAGFAVTACDDRPEMLDPALLPRAVERLRVDYADLAASGVAVCPRDFVVVCTSGHAFDYDVLVQVLPLHPAYIGCLGSARKAAYTAGRLLDAGFSTRDIDAIRTPAGVDIACETPEEIAVSIAAQAIDARRR